LAVDCDSTTQNQWADGYQLAMKMHFKFPQLSAVSLAQVMPNASSEALKLVALLLQWNPARRPTALQALKYVTPANKSNLSKLRDDRESSHTLYG